MKQNNRDFVFVWKLTCKKNWNQTMKGETQNQGKNEG